MRPTLFGVRLGAFYALCVGAYFATPYVNLFFMLLGFLSLVLVAEVAASLASLRGLVVGGYAECEFTLPAGTKPQVAMQLGNDGSRPRFGVSSVIELEGPGGRSVSLAGSAPALAPGRAVGLTLAGNVPLGRGIWHGEQVQLSSSYPFGVLRARRSASARVEVIVHPAPSEDLQRASGSTLREFMCAQLGGGEALAPAGVQPTSLREHRPGESLRSVHWRASARRGKLVALDWEADDCEALVVVLDRRATPAAFEGALSDLCAVALAAKEGKETLSVRTQGFDHVFGEGHGSFADLMRFLAEVETAGDEVGPPPAASPGALRLPDPRAEENGRAA